MYPLIIKYLLIHHGHRNKGDSTYSNTKKFICSNALICFVIIIGIGWFVVLDTFGSTHIYLFTMEIANHLAPPITATILLAMIVSDRSDRNGCATVMNSVKLTEQGAYYGLSIGFIFGMIRLIMFLSYSDYQLHEQPSFIGMVWVKSSPDLTSSLAITGKYPNFMINQKS